MDAKSESELRQLARDLFAEHQEEHAWPLFRDEANARGTGRRLMVHAKPIEQAVHIFEDEKVEWGLGAIDGSLVEQVAEAMAIYAWAPDSAAFIPKAETLAANIRAV